MRLLVTIMGSVVYALLLLSYTRSKPVLSQVEFEVNLGLHVGYVSSGSVIDNTMACNMVV